MRICVTALRALFVLLLASPCWAQSLPVQWEELTSADFVKALQAPGDGPQGGREPVARRSARAFAENRPLRA